jgi:hypothetical protein
MNVRMDVKLDLGKLDREMQDAAEKGLRQGGELILGEATRNAPIDTGALRKSGELKVKRVRKGAEATISFNTPYAAIQNDNPDFNHPKGGKAGYLTDALRNGIDPLKRAVAREIKRIKVRR